MPDRTARGLRLRNGATWFLRNHLRVVRMVSGGFALWALPGQASSMVSTDLAWTCRSPKPSSTRYRCLAPVNFAALRLCENFLLLFCLSPSLQSRQKCKARNVGGGGLKRTIAKDWTVAGASARYVRTPHQSSSTHSLPQPTPTRYRFLA